MELALLLGKYLVLILIYLFVYLVYRGLIAQTWAERAESLQARAIPPEVPIMKTPGPVRSGRLRPRRRQPTEAARPPAVEAKVSVQEALAEEPPAPSPEMGEPQPPEKSVSIPPLTPRLTVIHSQSVGVPVGSEFLLLAAATIGRAEHNLVRLDDRHVSFQHALIFLKEGRRVLRDRGSTNGTLLNGRALTGDVCLRDGDRITVGTTTLQYAEPDLTER